MWPVSSKFLEVVTGSHRAIVRVQVLSTPQFGPAPVGGLELPIGTGGGDVKLSATAAATLQLQTHGDYWEEVAPFGAELFVQRGIDYGDRTVELVPLGYFRIDEADQDDAPHGPIQVSATDRSAQARQTSRPLRPYQVPTGLTHKQLAELVINGDAAAGFPPMYRGVTVPIVWAGYDGAAAVPAGQVISDAGYDYLAKIVSERGCVLRWAPTGELRVELAEPVGDPVYAIEAGRTGTLVRASRSVSRAGVYNVVSAYGSDTAHPTGYQVAYNNDLNSPLYWQGKFGPAVRYYASPLLADDAAALEAATTLLARYTGLPTTLGLYTVPNPALQPLDVITAPVGADVQVHTVDQVTVPLSGGQLEIATRTRNVVEVIEPEPDPDPTPDPTPDPDPTGSYPADPGELLWIGAGAGMNHYNVGIGGAAAHVDHSQSEIYNGYSESPAFCLTPDRDAVQFRVSVAAATTPGSTYPRSELREFAPDGTTRAAWDARTGTHYMRGTTTVTHVAAQKPWVCIAQIHDAEDDVLRVQTELVGGQLALVARLNDVVTVLLPSYTVGTPIVWRLDVVNGALTVTIGGAVKLTGTLNNTGCYFKAGCYAQSNTDTEDGDASQYFAVELQDFVTWHTGYPTPTPPAYTGGEGGTTPPPGGDPSDGTQAATLLNWGPVVAGDEFAYTGAPDPNKWGVYNGAGHSGNGLRRPSAFNVANGILTCTGDNVSGGTTGGMAYRRESKYVRIEWRMRAYSIDPGAGGNRYHPVLIMWPTSVGRVAGGEYDFFESNCDSNKYGWFMHYPTEKPKVQEGGSFAFDIQNWHNYAFEWSRTGVRGFVDGVKKWEYNDSRMLSPDTMHPTFQLDNFYGSNMCPARMEAQWCRIYANPA